MKRRTESFLGCSHGLTVKVAELIAVPPGVVTVILPVLAVLGTVAVIWVEESTVKLVTLKRLKATRVTPVKLCPVITTRGPHRPARGREARN
jgi:hypothetical protein